MARNDWIYIDGYRACAVACLGWFKALSVRPPWLLSAEFEFALHDVNDNGKLDENWLGKPVEGYGFSNNAATIRYSCSRSGHFVTRLTAVHRSHSCT